MTDGRTFFNQPVKNDGINMVRLQKLWQVREMTIQLAVCRIVIVLGKQGALDADPKQYCKLILLKI